MRFMTVEFELPENTSKTLEYNGLIALAVLDYREKGLLYKQWRTGLRLPLLMVANELNVSQSIISNFERGTMKNCDNFEIIYQSYLQRNSMDTYSEASDFLSIEGIATDAIDVLSIPTGKQELLHKTCSTFIGYNEASEDKEDQTEDQENKNEEEIYI